MKSARRLTETAIIENNDAPIFNFCHIPEKRPTPSSEARAAEHSLPILMIERWDGTQLFALQANNKKRIKHA
jgi:hypothetical protein